MSSNVHGDHTPPSSGNGTFISSCRTRITYSDAHPPCYTVWFHLDILGIIPLSEKPVIVGAAPHGSYRGARYNVHSHYRAEMREMRKMHQTAERVYPLEMVLCNATRQEPAVISG